MSVLGLISFLVWLLFIAFFILRYCSWNILQNCDFDRIGAKSRWDIIESVNYDWFTWVWIGWVCAKSSFLVLFSWCLIVLFWVYHCYFAWRGKFVDFLCWFIAIVVDVWRLSWNLVDFDLKFVMFKVNLHDFVWYLTLMLWFFYFHSDSVSYYVEYLF